jgi:hypothetical protein
MAASDKLRRKFVGYFVLALGKRILWVIHRPEVEEDFDASH